MTSAATAVLPLQRLVRRVLRAAMLQPRLVRLVAPALGEPELLARLLNRRLGQPSQMHKLRLQVPEIVELAVGPQVPAEHRHRERRDRRGLLEDLPETGAQAPHEPLDDASLEDARLVLTQAVHDLIRLAVMLVRERHLRHDALDFQRDQLAL